jgi:hypothetical protein
VAFKALPKNERRDEPFAERDGKRNLNLWVIGH